MKIYMLLVTTALSCFSTNSFSKTQADAHQRHTPVYDVVLANCHIIDPESGTNMESGYIGINLGKDGSSVIQIVSNSPLSGSDYIDCEGKIAAPGFIDIHAHMDTIPSMRALAYDGVTTALELESGVLPIDMAYDNIIGNGQGGGGRPLNYGYSSAWTMARQAVMDNALIDGRVITFAKNFGGINWQKFGTPDESKRILALVEKGILDGSIGIGMNLGYAPDSNPEEFDAIAQLAAKYNVPVFVHTRLSNYRTREEDGKTNMTALNEAINLSDKYRANIHICHINSDMGRGDRLTGRNGIADGLKAIDAALERGVKITFETYPWGAASTVIGNPGTTAEGLWGDGIEPQHVYWNSQGRYIRDQADLDNARKTSPGDICIMYFMNESEKTDLDLLDQTVLHPKSIIAADGLALQIIPGKAFEFLEDDIWPIKFKDFLEKSELLTPAAYTHPRSLATHVKILTSYVRDRKLMSLMQAIKKSALMPAQLLEQVVPAMKKKGRIQAGADADIIVFDLSKLSVEATYEKSALSKGMSYVLVNGRVLIRDGKMQMDQMPGRPVRGHGFKNTHHDLAPGIRIP